MRPSVPPRTPDTASTQNRTAVVTDGNDRRHEAGNCHGLGGSGCSSKRGPVARITNGARRPNHLMGAQIDRERLAVSLWLVLRLALHLDNRPNSLQVVRAR